MLNHRIVISFILLGATLAGIPSMTQAEGMKGRLGIGAFGGQGVPLGPERLRDRTDVGTDVGGTLRYGLSKNWLIGASYENIYLENGIRREPLTLSGVYYSTPDKKWSPVGEFGLGAAASESGGPFTNFSMKAGIGAELFITRNFTIGPLVNFHFISHSGEADTQALVMVPGVITMLYFGGSEEQAQPAQAAAASVPVALFSIVPEQSTLGPGQKQQFNPSRSGGGDSALAWSINPTLGRISETGLYEAPESISFAQTVRVTAVNRTDESKTATALVQLQPPAGSAEEVSMRLEILFDTGKAVVKPSFDGELKKLGDFLKSYPTTSAQIEGHSDNTGSAEFNKSLSQKRADSVKNALVANQGIEASRLTAVGYGQEKPIADNNTAAGRTQNRRVVAVVKTTVQN